MVCFIVIGLATFMNAETRSSAESDTPCSLLGILCISLALVIDAANINIQVRGFFLACVWDGTARVVRMVLVRVDHGRIVFAT